MGVLTLNKIVSGAEAVVSHVMGDGPVTQRLLEMGMVPGASVKVLQFAPLGGPMRVTLDGYSLSLRTSEAALVALSS